MKRTSVGAFLAGLALPAMSLAVLFGPTGGPTASPLASPGFSFATGGDWSWGSNFDASLAALSTAGTIFTLALGDLSYDIVGTETAWCDDVKARLGPTYPVQLVSGNHEDDARPNGWIGAFIQCLPDRLGVTGTYGAEWYVDYPAASPLVRAILISPDLTVFGNYRDYAVGGMNYTWVSNAIDGARVAGIPWVVVGMHKVCITTGDKSCSIGTDLFDLLLNKRVDLILQGHDHNYQRSKQLTCATPNNYVPACVADDGADASYVKGSGSVIVISGNFGQCCHMTRWSDSEGDYFAAIDDNSAGFTRFDVTANRIDVTFVNNGNLGSFTDAFAIASTAGPGPQRPPAATAIDSDVSGNDVLVTWTPSNPETDVDHYEILASATYDTLGTGYATVGGNLPAGTTSFTELGAAAIPGVRFYRVRAVGPTGNYSDGAGQAARFTMTVGPGSRLLSLPVITGSLSVAGNLAGTAAWSHVRTFDAADATDGWKRFDPLRWNDITAVDRTIGVWVELAGGGDLRVAGKVPCTTAIALRPGWNLVGFPSMTSMSVAAAIAGLSGVITVETYDPVAAPYGLQRLAPSSLMRAGEGYWLHTSASQIWDIVNDSSVGCEGTGP